MPPAPSSLPHAWHPKGWVSANGLASQAAFVSIAVTFAAAIIYLHEAAAFTLPLPWGDEALFVWQARAFERWNTFIAPEIDATRPLLHQPFVYPTILGIAFKLFGHTLEIARSVSLAFLLVAFALQAAVARGRAVPFAALILFGVFTFNGHYVALGNVARMEAMFLAIVCAAMLANQYRQAWLGLAILSIGPMAHPNAVLFLIPVALYAIFQHGVLKERPSRTAIVIFALSAAIWIANAIYALRFWDGLIYDIAHRVGATSATHEGGSQLARLVYGLLGIAGIALVPITLGVRTGLLLIFAVGAWLTSRIRLEQWYEPFASLTFVLVSIAILELLAHALASYQRTSSRWTRCAVVSAATLVLILAHIRGGRLEGPRNYLAEVDAAGMHLQGSVPYFTAGDREAIRSFIASVEPARNIVVEVHPWGDGLLIGDVDEPRARIQVPYLDAIHQPADHWAWGYKPTEYPTPDVYLIHVSRYQPEYLAPRRNLVMSAALQRAGTATAVVVTRRDQTEVWYGIRTHKP